MANLVNSDTESALELLQKKFKEDTADELAVCHPCVPVLRWQVCLGLTRWLLLQPQHKAAFRAHRTTEKAIRADSMVAARELKKARKAWTNFKKSETLAAKKADGELGGEGNAAAVVKCV